MSDLMPKIIYVPVDGSEGSIKAAQTALTMAQPMAARVELLFAFPRNAYELFGMPAEFATQQQMQYLNPDEFEKLRANNAEQVFNKIRTTLGDTAAGISDQHLLAGEPGQAVIDHVTNVPQALIIVGSRGMSRVRGLLIGSVSQRLTQHAPCPVMVIR